MKKILLFARDPGGANAISPLDSKLRARGYEVLLYGKDAALAQYRNSGLTGRDLALEAPVVSVDAYRSFLQSVQPDFILTGTGSDDFAEKFFWQAAEQLKIPCFAILDHWFNYGIRFSPYKLVEQDRYEQDRRHPYLPTRILVMDEAVREAMLAEGFTPDRIRVAGQPHFDALREQAERFGPQTRHDYRQQYALTERDFLLAFISENITEPEKGDDLSKYYWGYTERSVFRNLMTALRPLADQGDRRVHVVVKPHPNETWDAYSELIAELAGGKLTASIDKAVHPVALCKAADLICGMSSMVLVEAVILGLQVLSVQIGLVREDPFILSRKGILSSILDPAELRQELAARLSGAKAATAEFPVPAGAAERIIGWMEEWL